MLSTSHPELKTQIVDACLEIFPEAKSILFWGGSVTPDFSPTVNDIDVIIEVDSDFTQEIVLAERLKTLVLMAKGYRLDPFLYLTAASDEALEFVAPFGFYKANPFIPYLIRNQHEVAYGQSRLLGKLPPLSLSSALLGILPMAMGALKRLRMDIEVEQAWAPLAAKHRASLFMILRTYFAFEHGSVGSKKEALRFLAQKFPRYQSISDRLLHTLEARPSAAEEPEAPSVDVMLAFVKDMEESLQAAKRRETAAP